ncbi:hypothetical protein D779_1810 [Imhoffiella purpurea]|uniref:Uncharacterized protein n=1 Tax=Imhoffiella purpurea TaxID=1249627 RepID=W9VLK5_9GAMM|nr:hypothetical protein D779_1810 [Imhoffiella purpurea]
MRRGLVSAVGFRSWQLHVLRCRILVVRARMLHRDSVSRSRARCPPRERRVADPGRPRRD